MLVGSKPPLHREQGKFPGLIHLRRMCRGAAQNSSRVWNATMRGLLSPPKPTPSKPVGGEVV